MTAIKYRIRKEAQNPASISMILTEGKQYAIKTGLSANPALWNFKKGETKEKSPFGSELNLKLEELKNTLLEEINRAKLNEIEINKPWIEESIDKYFNRGTIKDANELKVQINYVIDNASTKRIKGTNRIGLSKGRLQNYNSFLKIVIEYEKYIKRVIYLKSLNSSFTEEFKNWLIKEKAFSKNYAGKQLGNLRAVAMDAKKREIEVHEYASQIESFAESNSDRLIVTLSFEELEIIEKTEMPNNYLENAKKWMLLGCDIGQRGGDLLNITTKDIRYIEDQPLIDVTQEKTDKEITAPVTSTYVKKMIKEGLPHKISDVKLNKYIKTVCELAGIDELEEGSLYDGEVKRKVKGKYPKYKLVTTHSFRRSFATNYYKKVPTPILINITGHSKESVFLYYINKKEDKDDNANLFLKYANQM